jgi:hypothetical protein
VSITKARRNILNFHYIAAALFLREITGTSVQTECGRRVNIGLNAGGWYRSGVSLPGGLSITALQGSF